MSERAANVRRLNVGDVLRARPCVVTITITGEGGTAWGVCAACGIEHVINQAMFEDGRGPWRRDDNGSSEVPR